MSNDFMPPVLRAYVRTNESVGLLKKCTDMGCEYPHMPYPWARAAYYMILNERSNCCKSLEFCTGTLYSQVETFVSDLGSLATKVYALREHCRSLERAPPDFLTPGEIPTKDRTDVMDAQMAEYKKVIAGVNEHLALITQQFVLCRHTAREMYPEHFGLPMFERPLETTLVLVNYNPPRQAVMSM